MPERSRQELFVRNRGFFWEYGPAERIMPVSRRVRPGGRWQLWLSLERTHCCEEAPHRPRHRRPGARRRLPRLLVVVQAEDDGQAGIDGEEGREDRRPDRPRQ